MIGVKLTGKLNGWTAQKDVILSSRNSYRKRRNRSHYRIFWPWSRVHVLYRKGTICNMGAEVGATTSTFGYDSSMERYLRATGRDDVADAANQVKEHLTADPEVYTQPEKYFDQVIEINLDSLMPHINGPFTPDLATPVDQMSEKATEGEWPLKVEWGLIGSCTNSSYEDLSRAASIPTSCG